MTDPSEVGLQGREAGAATATTTNITGILSILSTHTSIPGRISGSSVFGSLLRSKNGLFSFLLFSSGQSF